MPKYLITVKYLASVYVEAETQAKAEDMVYEPEYLDMLADQLSDNGYQPEEIVAVEQIILSMGD